MLFSENVDTCESRIKFFPPTRPMSEEGPMSEAGQLIRRPMDWTKEPDPEEVRGVVKRSIIQLPPDLMHAFGQGCGEAAG